MTFDYWLAALAVLVAAVLAALRWMRVAQREHYAPGEVTTIAGLWLTRRPVNVAFGAVILVLATAGFWLDWFTLVAMVLLAFWPLGLAVRGRTAKLVWTARAQRAGATVAVLELVLISLAMVVGPSLAGLVAIATPLIADLGLWVVAPVERKLASRFVDMAAKKLRTVAPRIVAITGSYGKTSTKLYVQRLLSRHEAVLVSPASFNNMMGLSRTVNDQLQVGTSVFVAEMGTYGEGEIRELCAVFSPEVAAITTIGEAHLSRMKDRATIVRAKCEITEGAPSVVVNVDVPELAALADQLAATKRVVRCSTDSARSDADVVVSDVDGQWQVQIGAAEFTRLPAPGFGHPINLAIAIGIATVLDVSLRPEDLAGELPTAAHRAEALVGENGVLIIDDTYNSNPVGAAKAVTAAGERLREGGRLYTVTPGMVELGAQQAARNAELARLAVARPQYTLVVVGWTNRSALLKGAGEGPGKVLCFEDRDAATAGILVGLGATDVVLYENDLPDHYP
jgi:UDP-N-acetylmuramoyl-tripeptide--D-alanyl-D-alanine ligase